MAYYDGASLKDRLAHEPLPFEETIDIALMTLRDLRISLFLSSSNLQEEARKLLSQMDQDK